MTEISPLNPRRWEFKEPVSNLKSVPNPPGYSFVNIRDDSSAGHRTQVNNREILEKRSWDLAMSPGKSIFMNLFMIWMMGSGSGIFSILMVGYAVLQSFTSLVGVNEGT